MSSGSFPCEIPQQGPTAVFAANLQDRIPTLETERLRLRAPCLEDFAAYFAIVGGPRGAHVGGPMAREEAWYDFIQMSSGWLLQGHGGWTVTPKKAPEPVGFVILGFEPGDQEPELGYLLTEAGEGQGFAQEAALAVRDYAETQGLTRLVSYVARDNARSAALAMRLGAARDPAAEARLGQHDMFVYRHPSKGQIHD